MLFGRQAGRSRLLEKQAAGLSLGLAGIVFLVNQSIPLGAASGVPYSLAILLASNAAGRRYPVMLAVLCSLLSMSDVAVNHELDARELWGELANCGLALFMIWFTLALGVRIKWLIQRQREAEEVARQHLSDLAHMSRVEWAGQLAASLTHELNQPLAAITLQSEIATQILRRDQSASPHVMEALDEVTDQAGRAAGIIRSLRRLLSNHEPQRTPIQLNDIVGDVTQLMNSQFQQAGVCLRVRCDARNSQVVGDRTQLEQVLINLLQNALDAVADVDESSRQILVETRDDGPDRLTVRVRDNGAGLSLENVERVFDRFYSSKPTGMGMGLAISRAVIDSHRGRLWAEPGTERGAVFSFSLPRETIRPPARIACLTETNN